jgi:PhnB protein
MSETANLSASVAPWLFVRDSIRAVEFYQTAFGASEKYRLEERGGVVARLAIGSSEFWVGDESPEQNNFSPDSLSGSTLRMILTVADPDAAFAQACQAGALVVHPIAEGHGWCLGRVVDPFGHHWEIGRQITP